MSLHDLPLDSLRQRIERTVALIEADTYGDDNFYDTIKADLRAALELPDFSVEQQQEARNVLAGLRYSGGINRPKVAAMFVSDLLGWLKGYSNVLADGVDHADKRLEQTEKHRHFYSRETDRLTGKVERLTAQRNAVRDFFTGQGDDEDD